MKKQESPAFRRGEEVNAEEAEWLRGLDDTDWRSGDLTARYRTYEDALVAAQKWIDAR